MDATERITALEDVPEESTRLFRVRPIASGGAARADAAAGGSGASDAAGTGVDGNQDGALEAILVRADGEVTAWLNYCQHFTHIRLDKGSGAPMRNGELVCTNHGAYFEADSGRCTYGPCEGAYLNAVSVSVADGAVWLADDEYRFVGLGGIDRDDADLRSNSNVEF